MQNYKVSVAMTIFNGEKYLLKQLESLLAQTRKIDELIACDDGSTDKTEAIFAQFVEKNNLLNWHYKKNSNNLGAMKNFINAASLCNGDIVFFCDQDDVWDCNKVANMLNVFFEHNDAIVVSCSEVYMDSEGNLLQGQSKLHRESDKKKTLSKIPFERQIKTMHSPGLTLAFRKEFIEETAPLTYKEGLTYDITMGLVASLKGGMYRLYQPLVYRRIHASNFSRPALSLSARVKNYDHHIEGRKLQFEHMKVILNYYGNELSDTDRKHLVQRINSTQKTIKYLENKNIFGLFALCFSLNPMDNIKLNIGNVLIAMFAKKNA